MLSVLRRCLMRIAIQIERKLSLFMEVYRTFRLVLCVLSDAPVIGRNSIGRVLVQIAFPGRFSSGE